MPVETPSELAEVYRAIRASGTATKPQLAEQIGTTDEKRVSRAVDQLVTYGFVERSTSRRGAFHVIDPVAGFGQAIEGVLDQLGGELGALSELARECRREDSTTGEGTSLVGVTRVRGRDARLRELSILNPEIRRSVGSLHSDLPSASAFSAAQEQDRRLLERGVAMRNIYPEAARHSQAVHDYITALSPLGAEFRTTLSIPVRVQILDNTVAIVSSAPNDPNGEALVVRNKSLVSALSDYFELLWRSARVLAEDEPATETELDRISRIILDGLIQGRTDKDIAASIGQSAKTVSRRIDDLYRITGAASRFTLGVQAERRGWLGY